MGLTVVLSNEHIWQMNNIAYANLSFVSVWSSGGIFFCCSRGTVGGETGPERDWERTERAIQKGQIRDRLRSSGAGAGGESDRSAWSEVEHKRQEVDATCDVWQRLRTDVRMELRSGEGGRDDAGERSEAGGVEVACRERWAGVRGLGLSLGLGLGVDVGVREGVSVCVCALVWTFSGEGGLAEVCWGWRAMQR